MKTKILSDTYHIDSRTIHIGIVYHQRNKQRIPVNKTVNIPDFALTRWHSIKHRAAKKAVPFAVTVEQIRELINRPCEYCNDTVEPSQIDRKVPSLGYVYSNLAPACRRCNTIKNDVVSYDEMVKIVEILNWKK